MKHIDSASVINVLRPLNALVACAWFSVFNVAHAVDSADTLPVYGRGAPSAPTLSVSGFGLNESITANVGQATDPDGDPITYDVWWCTGANRTGTCVTGTRQTFSTTATRYVSARAVTPRGYPAATQGQGAWSREVTTVYGDLITKSGIGTFMKPPDSTGRSWWDADRLCNDIVYGGYSDWRLPTEAELKALYQLYGYNGVGSRLGWPTGSLYYWSATESTFGGIGTGTYRYVGLLDGAAGNSSGTIGRLVTCIRV